MASIPLTMERPAVLLHCLEDGSTRLPSGSESGRAALPGPNTLVLPAVKTGLVHVPVTPREYPHLRQSLPWMLEEQLGVAPDSMHFAHGPLQDGIVQVVYVDRHWFSAVLQKCAASGLTINRVVSELQLLPWHPGCWSMLVRAESGQVLLRDGKGRGLVCSAENLEQVLALLAEQETPAKILLQEMEKSAVALIPERYRSALQHIAKTGIQEADAETLVNLRQGEFAVPLPWGQWWRQWRWAAMLVAGLFLTDLGITLVETRTMQQQLTASENELAALFAATLPDAVMVDPVLQLQRAVATLDGSERTGMLSLLTRMAPALSGNSGNTVQSISWDDGTGELQLQLNTDSFAAAEQFRARLETLGLQAELLGSSSDANGSRARLRIRS